MTEKLIDYKIYEQDRRLYMELHYEYETSTGVFLRHIPKVDLAFTRDRMPEIFEQSPPCDNRIRINGVEYTVRPTNIVSGDLLGSDKVYYVDKLVREKVKKMTLSEIEEKLGYKIEIIDDDEIKKG